MKATIHKMSLRKKPVSFSVKEAAHMAVIGSVLFPVLLEISPTQGPIFVFLIIFAVFVRD